MLRLTTLGSPRDVDDDQCCTSTMSRKGSVINALLSSSFAAESRSSSRYTDDTSYWRSKRTRLIGVCAVSMTVIFGAFAGRANIAGVVGHLANAGSVSSTSSFLTSYAAKAVYHGAHTPYIPSSTSLPPALFTLPDELRRITLISIWSSDDRPPYLNNFFRSAALNADVMDLLVVHITNNQSRCLDGQNNFGKTDGIDRSGNAWNWQDGKGNIKVICMSRETNLQLKRDFLCRRETGWSCDERQADAVLSRLRHRPDVVNTDWKPLHGEIYYPYFIHPRQPLWGWTDMDMHLGRLTHLLFSLLAQFSLVAIHSFSPSLLFLPGQMSLFNLASPGSLGSWRNYDPLAGPEGFSANVGPEEGGYPEGGVDESWLSAAWLRSTHGYAGQNLSWAHVSDVHGQDIFIPGRKFVISGRDTLEVDADLARIEIEAILYEASEMHPDDYAGWSEQGVVVEQEMQLGEICKAWFTPKAAQCVQQHELSIGDQFLRVDSVRRSTVMHLPDDGPNVLRTRLEPDHRPRRWQRKLFIHYQEIKRQNWWWELPPYFIGDNDEVLVFDWRVMEVWRKGPNRKQTIWERRNGRLDEHGVSRHTMEIDVTGKSEHTTTP